MVEIANENGIEVVVSDPSIEADVVNLNELDIRIAKKEYTIVGDNIYIPKLYDDAPEWMKNLVQIVVDVSLETGNTDLINQLNSVLSEFATQYVPLNQYTQSILDLSNEDTRINAVIETLNSNYNDGISEANAQIIGLQLTKASKTEVVAQVLQTISAELQNGESDLGAVVARLDQAIADESSARAMSFETVMASIENLDGTVSGEASATSNLYAYVGYERDGSATGTGLLADVQILQKQNDGVIETVTGTYDVMINPQDPNLAELVLTAEPYASWKAQDVSGVDTRLAHIGDVYIKYGITSNGAREYIASFKFIRTVVDASDAHKSTDADGFTWALIVDQAAQDAYNQALNAYDLADGKRRIFVGLGTTSTPSVPYDQGDLWLIDATRVVNGYSCKVGDILRCIETKGKIGVYEENDWVLASSYANAVDAQNQQFLNFVNNDYAGFVTNIQSQVDKKAETFYQNSIPTGRIKSINVPDNVTLNTYVGDLWKNTYVGTISGYLGNNTEYIYTKTANGSNWNYDWVKMEVPDIVFDTIDTKKSIYSGNSVPVAVYPDVIEVNDMWIPSANTGSYKSGEVYIYNGTTWVVATKYTADLEAVRTNLQGQLDGKVETYYQATVPTGMTALNNGDYWYCTADVSTYKKGKVYKYVHATTLWVETADVSRYAFDVADGKAAIFSSTNLPTSGYKINDMLIVVGSFNNGTTTFADGVVLSSTVNRTSGFTPADWVKKINDTEDLDAFVSSTYTPAVTSLQNQVDGKVESWFQNSTSDPKTAWTDTVTRSKHDGDLWYQLDTKRSYWYSSSTNAWNLIEDEKAIQALTNAAAAQTAANNAQTSANTANSLLADIASDNKLVPSEKVAVKKEWDIIQSEYTKNLAQGNVYGVSTSSYTSAYNSLSGYITPLLNSLTATSDIVGTTFRSMFKAYYDANVDLLNAVANKINAIADGKITSYYIETFSSLQALSNGWTTAEKASNVGDLATVWNDSTLDNNGLWRWNGTSWISARDKKLVSLASEVTNLSTELNNGTNTWASADSELENSVRTEISSEGARVESKFAYNSMLMLNEISYSSGFGIATSLTSGSGLPTGQSEFWIKADKFKLMSADGSKKSSYSPFTVDSVTGEINFNGKVTFSNVTDVPQLGSTPQEVVNAVNSGQTTTIDGGKITTGSVTANQIQAGSISADRFSSTSGTSTVWAGGGLVSANFNGNVNGSIGSPTQGFRLSSNAVGTSTDPNIYGAYIKGGTLEGTSLNGISLAVSDIKVRAVGYPNNYGPIYISEDIVKSENDGYTSTFVLYSNSYSSGYNPYRLCNAEQSISITASSYAISSSSNTVSVIIQVSYDNVNWTNIASNLIVASPALTVTIKYNVVASFNALYIRSYHSATGFTGALRGGLLSIRTTNGQ